jgi:hypothetical protein
VQRERERERSRTFDSTEENKECCRRAAVPERNQDDKLKANESHIQVREKKEGNNTR